MNFSWPKKIIPPQVRYRKLAKFRTAREVVTGPAPAHISIPVHFHIWPSLSFLNFFTNQIKRKFRKFVPLLIRVTFYMFL